MPRRLGELERAVQAWKAAFAAAPGERYVLHSLDALDFVGALLGAWYAGKCVLVPSDLQLGSITRSGIAIDGVVGVDGGLRPAAPVDEALPPLDPAAASLEMFTSGSAGQPTAIPKRLRQLEQEIAGLAAVLDWGTSSRRVLGTVSHQHMYGLVFRVLLPLAIGRPFEAARLARMQDLQLVDAPEGCTLISSPAQLARLPTPDLRHQGVGAVLSAGGPLEEVDARACQAFFGVCVTEIYGSSETGAVAWRCRPSTAPRWQPLPGVEFREQHGILEIRTPQLPTNEWFRSADRVIVGRNGFELAGRADRIVKLEEKRVSLDAVERVLLESGLLLKARALVLAGPRSMLAVAALPNAAGWALAEVDKRNLADRLHEHLQRSAQIEVLPRSWRFVDPWPVTVDGKTPESLLRERFDRRNPEFRVLERQADACVVDLWVSPTAPFFAGHFPGQPVLPGVVQIDWLVWLSRQLLGVEAGFSGLEAAKFRRVILPKSRLNVSLRHDVAAHRTSYQIRQSGDVCATGRIRWDQSQRDDCQ
jgi:acyl-CoA synthetase (AMP-forming)/AMP-acid ligase II/3-hydroxymyristoyl/3-hydroxydecanoyl-(acyl carrier protein) dehydratase